MRAFEETATLAALARRINLEGLKRAPLPVCRTCGLGVMAGQRECWSCAAAPRRAA